MRWASISVLPVPAPAITSSGPALKPRGGVGFAMRDGLALRAIQFLEM